MLNLIQYTILTIVFFSFAWLIFRSFAFYKNLSEKQVDSRYETIDGLRGFLALAVFIHHAVISQQFFRTGQWRITLEYPLYHFAANIGVSLFFMITGFLFWSKVLVILHAVKIVRFSDI